MDKPFGSVWLDNQPKIGQKAQRTREIKPEYIKQIHAVIVTTSL